MVNFCCSPFSNEAIPVKWKSPTCILVLIPNNPWFEPPNITYLVEGKDKPIFPASILWMISSSSPSYRIWIVFSKSNVASLFCSTDTVTFSPILPSMVNCCVWLNLGLKLPWFWVALVAAPERSSDLPDRSKEILPVTFKPTLSPPNIRLNVLFRILIGISNWILPLSFSCCLAITSTNVFFHNSMLSNLRRSRT